MKLTKNISRYELACSCGCGFDSMDWETIKVVQSTCDHFAEKMGIDKVVLRINSAARCYEYNRLPVSEGGPGSNDASQHPKARAIDFTIDGVKPADAHAFMASKYPDRYGLGRYETFTHLDTRTGPAARW
jgi:uncharacterized protein YcbK (DUF882 family)